MGGILSICRRSEGEEAKRSRFEEGERRSEGLVEGQRGEEDV